MSEQNDSTASELDLDTSADAEHASDSQDTTEAQDQTSEPEKTDLSFLDGEDTSVEQSEQKAKSLIGQVNAAQKNIDAGKKTVNDFPEYIQEELKQRNVVAEVQKETPSSDIVEKVVKQLKQQETFENLKSELKGMSLSKEQAEGLSAEYKALKDSGLPDLKSLETAVRLSGLTKDVTQARQQGIELGRMALGSQGEPQSMRKQEVDPLTLTGDDFFAWSEKQKRNEKGHLDLSNANSN